MEQALAPYLARDAGLHECERVAQSRDLPLSKY